MRQDVDNFFLIVFLERLTDNLARSVLWKKKGEEGQILLVKGFFLKRKKSSRKYVDDEDTSSFGKESQKLEMVATKFGESRLFFEMLFWWWWHWKGGEKEVRWKYCINTNGSWHTSSNVRTPTLYCETKNKLKYWVIHSQMSEKERKQSSKVTTLRFSEMWDIVQFRRQQTDISDRPYERVRESFSLFGISP